jgi:hypothetical protein
MCEGFGAAPISDSQEAVMTPSTARLARPRAAHLVLVAIAAAAIAAGVASARGAAGPTNTSAPTITGVALTGNTLQASPGTWNPADVTVAYRWLRCDPAGGDDSSDKTCSTIDGATRQTYTVASADIGKRIRVRVSASNRGGTTEATSAATSVVATPGGKPASSSAPTIAGSPVVGSKLVGSPGTWVGDAPITYSYQWLRCDPAGNACNPISGRTKSEYTPVDNDVGKTLRLKVVARNSRGNADAFSTATGPVQDSPNNGVITLPNGEKSVDAKDVPKDQRLVVDQVTFSPNPVTSVNETISVRIKVKDTRGNVVRNAIVFIRSTPKVTSGGDHAPTATDGWVQYGLQPEKDFPIKNSYSVQFYVKAYRANDPTLGGIYGSRLVQVATKKP